MVFLPNISILSIQVRYDLNLLKMHLPNMDPRMILPDRMNHLLGLWNIQPAWSVYIKENHPSRKPAHDRAVRGRKSHEDYLIHRAVSIEIVLLIRAVSIVMIIIKFMFRYDNNNCLVKWFPQSFFLPSKSPREQRT